MLYWTGVRERRAPGLTPDSFDWKKSTMRIDKSYQRLGMRRDNRPKTPEPKSVRTVKMSRFLAIERCAITRTTTRDWRRRSPVPRVEARTIIARDAARMRGERREKSACTI